MTILVSGASGFLGKKLITELSTKNNKILAIYRSDIDESFLNLPNIEWLNFDLSKGNINLNSLPKINTVVHLAGATLGAGTNENTFFESNEMTTFNLLSQLSEKCRNFIYASSQVIYGDICNLKVNEGFQVDVTESAYACSKVNSENWLKWFQGKTKGNYLSLRFCGFIDGGGLIDYVISNALQDKEIKLFSNGNIIRDYISSSDGIDAIIKSIQYIDSIENKYIPINIGSGQPLSALNISNLIVETLNSKSNIVTLTQKGPQGDLILDISRARELINYEPLILENEIKNYALKKQSNL